MNHPDACRGSRSGCGFPGTANVRQKPPPRCRVFIQNLIAPVTVEANGGCAEENPGWMGKVGQGFTKQFRPADAAIANPLFDRGGPPLSNGFSRKMNHCIESCLSAKFNLIFLRKPKRLRITRARSPEKRFHLVTSGAECRQQRRANQAGRPRDENSHLPLGPKWPVRVVPDSKEKCRSGSVSQEQSVLGNHDEPGAFVLIVAGDDEPLAYT